MNKNVANNVHNVLGSHGPGPKHKVGNRNSSLFLSSFFCATDNAYTGLK